MSCVLYSFCLRKQEVKTLDLHIALIDKSEITLKILSHCLYYYTVQVHRFDSFEDYLVEFNDKKPKLIFIDWEIKQDDRPLIFTAIEQVHSIPFILLYRKGFESELLTVPKNQVSYQIKKPLNPKEIRTACVELIPELKKSAFHSFLKFPKSEEEKKQEQNKSSLSKQTAAEEDHQKTTEDKTKSFIGSLIEKSGLFKMSSSEEIEQAEEDTASEESAKPAPDLTKSTGSDFQTVTDLTSTEASSSKSFDTTKTQTAPKKGSQDSHIKTMKTTITLTDKKPSSTSRTLSQNLGSLAKKLKETETESLKKKSSKESSFELNSRIVKKEGKTFDKDNIDIDEDTQNDLAPMAIKSSSQPEIKLESSSLTKQDIQRAFDKYKDSLEFQKMMEKTLSEHVQEVVAGILKEDSVSSILKKPLEDFKESDQFKLLVKKEISQYIQKQLPFVIKRIVENEIKKIIGD